MNAEAITVETRVAAPLARVWKTYTTPEDIVHWNAASDDWHTTAATVDLRIGGAFTSRMEAKDGSMGFDFAGTYTKIVDRSLLAYEFGGRAAEITFAQDDDAVKVSVMFEPETQNPVDMQRAGWQAILDSFARYTEAL